MKNKDLEIAFVLKLIEVGDNELRDMYSELLKNRLEEAEERNRWVDDLKDEIIGLKIRASSGKD